MKIEMIDLNKFYDKKYSYVNNTGIGAVSVITPKQMVTRINSESFDYISNSMVSGLGPHDEEQIAIIRDIYGLPDVLDNGIGYYDPDFVELTDDYKKLLKEVITIKYTNCPGSMNAAIYLPEDNKCLTKEEISTIKYVGKEIEKVANNLNIDIVIGLKDGDNVLEETNSVDNVLIPYLERYITDNHTLSLDDVNIIAQHDLEINQKTI